MAKRKNYSPEQIIRVCAMRVIGKTYKEIRGMSGFTNSQITSALRQHKLLAQRETVKLGSIAERRGVLVLYRQGVPVDDIAEKLSVGRSAIYLILHEFGVEFPNQKERAVRMLTGKQKADIAWRYEVGREDGPALVEEYGVSTATIYKTLQKAGVKRRGWTGPRGTFLKYLADNGRLCRFRSSWELAFAKHLDARGLEWSYESHTWLLSDGGAYTPDFWIPDWDVFVEIKGHMVDDARVKIEMFRREYPHLRLLVLGRKALELYGITFKLGRAA